jgi:hypothetical protein
MKTNEELQITRAERLALLNTRALLRDPFVPLSSDRAELGLGVSFNMSASSEIYECGTAMCIGGFMKLFMLGAKPTSKGVYNITPKREELIDKYVLSHEPFFTSRPNSNRPIAKLFYPPDELTPWSNITKEMAIKAIDNFLKTGKPDWMRAAGR